MHSRLRLLQQATEAHRLADGVSSNGRTAVSGTVCEGSTPSTPAIFAVYCTAHYVAPSSSGLGRRPLKAEVAGSNPVGATKKLQVRSAQAPDLFLFDRLSCAKMCHLAELRCLTPFSPKAFYRRPRMLSYNGGERREKETSWSKNRTAHPRPRQLAPLRNCRSASPC